ncbi:MAG: alkaline phosphatase D family protein [Gemmataceae bacterium]|nr:alkaline phosphatase family protein [Gemmata sp.]MDW8196908.1 alkaline phosphatase D family protein [Gemmataceae bacterium]
MRYRWLVGLLVTVGIVPVLRADDPTIIRKIAFGSCVNQDKPVPIFDTIAATKPDLFLMIGDNMYADLDRTVKVTPEVIREKYHILAKVPGFVKIKQVCPRILGTWDDHDYGRNDAGAEWQHKDAAQKEFHDFFGTPENDPRRQQKGIYHAAIYGPVGQRLQVILLDTRYFRSPLKKGKFDPVTRITPYLPNTDPDATLLGPEQWKWLEEQLKKPAEVRLLVSSIQVIADEHPFEKWANFPHEREKLYALLKRTGANGVVILSGDRHLADISVDTRAIGYPLYDITSSGFNQASKNWRPPEKNSYRVAGMPYGDNFGFITIDWNDDNPRLVLQIRDEDGETACGVKVRLSTLKNSARGVEPPRPEGVLTPDQAAQKPGETVTVQFLVRSVGGKTTIYLNSHPDFRAKDNFAVHLTPKAQTGRWEKVAPESFLGKTIRATGKVQMNKYDQPQLEVVDEKALVIVE